MNCIKTRRMAKRIERMCVCLIVILFVVLMVASVQWYFFDGNDVLYVLVALLDILAQILVAKIAEEVE